MLDFVVGSKVFVPVKFDTNGIKSQNDLRLKQ